MPTATADKNIDIKYIRRAQKETSTSSNGLNEKGLMDENLAKIYFKNISSTVQGYNQLSTDVVYKTPNYFNEVALKHLSNYQIFLGKRTSLHNISIHNLV